MSTVWKMRIAGISVITYLLFIYSIPSTVTSRPVHATSVKLSSPADIDWKGILSESDIEELNEWFVDDISKKKRLRASSLFLRNIKSVKRSGLMIAILGNWGTKVLEGEAQKKAATLRDAGIALFKASDEKDFDKAKAAFEIIENYPKKVDPSEDAAFMAFSEFVDMHEMMEGMNLFDSNIGKASRGSKTVFSKATREMPAQAKFIAAMNIVGHEMAEDYGGEEDWKKWSIEGKDIAMKLSEAFADKDQEKTQTSYEELKKNCDACHAVYAPDE